MHPHKGGAPVRPTSAVLAQRTTCRWASTLAQAVDAIRAEMKASTQHRHGRSVCSSHRGLLTVYREGFSGRKCENENCFSETLTFSARSRWLSSARKGASERSVGAALGIRPVTSGGGAHTDGRQAGQQRAASCVGDPQLPSNRRHAPQHQHYLAAWNDNLTATFRRHACTSTAGSSTPPAPCPP